MGLCAAKIAPDPRPLGQGKSWPRDFCTFVTTFFQPRLAENDTNLSFSHENNGFTPLLIWAEVVKLVMGVSSI